MGKGYKREGGIVRLRRKEGWGKGKKGGLEGEELGER